MKAIILLQEFRKIKVGNDFVGYQELKEEVQSQIDEAIKELELLDNDLKDLFCCIELTEDENAEKRLSSMETYLIRLSKYIK